MATRSHCRAGYNCHWGALQAGCAQQSGSVGPRVALQGVNYTTAPGARPAHLSPRGGRNPGASSGGRHEPGAGRPPTIQVVAKGLSGRPPPLLPPVPLAHRGHMVPCPPSCQTLAKTAGRWGFLPAHQHQCSRFSYCSIGEGCRGINGFKLIRRTSGSSC